MANTAAITARATDADRLDEATLKQLRNHYRGAIAKGNTDNRGKPQTSRSWGEFGVEVHGALIW